MADNSKVKIFSPYPGFQQKFVCSNVDFVIGGGAMASGKEQPLDSLVLTPNGWVPMGDIRVGDLVMTPFDGPTRVLGVFPQGEKDVYRISTSDGRTCECGLEHLWAVRTKKTLSKFRRTSGSAPAAPAILTTRQIIEYLNGNPNRRLYIPNLSALPFAERNLPIHPYALGVILGDGCTSGIKSSNGENIIISNPESDIRQKFATTIGASAIKPDSNNRPRCTFRTPLGPKIRQYLINQGLNCRSFDKFIPQEYLFASVEQRRQLLAGIFDTDGNVQQKNAYRISTTSHRLASDIVALCRSLGYIATITVDKRSHKYTSGAAFAISICTDDIIFTSEKHRSRYENFQSSYSRNYSRTKDHVSIVRVEKVRKAECQCILVENEKHLYITDDYIVTHNTFGALLMAAPHVADPNFRMVFIRRYTGDVKAGGGGIDEATKIYGPIAQIRQSENPRLSFPSGALIDFTHMSDQKEDNVLERVKGWQYSCIYVDEATAHEWSTIRILMSRNRSQAKWTGKFRVTCNPKRRSWLRYWVDWYVDEDGYPVPERDGIVRYFYVKGREVNDVVLGDSPEEVYDKCAEQIDSILSKMNAASDGDIYTYRDLIKSYTYYAGNIAENKALMRGNAGYAGSVAAMGEKQAKANLLGCWNVDDDDDNTLIRRSDAQSIAENAPQRNGSRWITVDLADTGTDNCVIIAWDGLHIIDFQAIQKSTPAVNCRMIEHIAARNGVGEAHIIYDAVRAAYMVDYFPSAVPYVSYKPAIGIYKRIGERLKDILFLRLVECVNNSRISVDPAIAALPYEHAGQRTTTFIDEFVRECLTVNFTTTVTGKRRLWSKKEMKAALGSHLSPDLLDCIAARFLPLADYEYGEELQASPGRHSPDPYDSVSDQFLPSIYDDSTWF